MMYRKLIWTLGMALALLIGAACSKEERPSEVGTVSISFRVGDPATRAETPGDGNVADGGGIYCTREAGSPVVLTPDLYIFICDINTGAVVKRYLSDGTGEGAVDPDSNWSDGNKSTFLSIRFPFNNAGTYSVYALANVGGGDSNLTLPSAGDLASIPNASSLDALFVSLSASTLDVGSRMPLSAKGVLTVEKGLNDNKYNGHVELEMLRCVNKVQLSFENLTGAVLNLYHCQVTFKDMNVQRGWLFPTNPDFVTMGDSEDEGDLDDNYRDYTSAPRDVTGIVEKDTVPFFTSPVLFLPSVAPMQTAPSKGTRYLCDVSFRIQKDSSIPYNSEDESTYTQKSFPNLPIHTPRSEDITALGRNQYLQIVTTVSKGESVSFNFKVKEWDAHTETIHFD